MTERNLSYIGGKGTFVISANWATHAASSSCAKKTRRRNGGG